MAKKLTAAILGLLLAVYLGYLFQLALHGPFDADELESVHTAWKMAHGERVYVDFFQNHHEAFYCLLVPFIRIWGDSLATIQAINVFCFGLFLAKLWLTYLIAARIFNREIGLLSVILLSTNMAYWEAMNIRPDSPQTLFGLISVYFFLAYYHQPGIGKLLLSAASLAISFLFLQKALFLIFLLGCIQVVAVFRKKMKVSDFFLYWLGFGLVLAPYFLHHILHTTWTTYWNCNWLFNMHYLGQPFPRWLRRFLLSSYSDNMLMLIFCAGGLLNCLKPDDRRMLAVLALGLFASAFQTPIWGAQYFMMALPFMAIIAATVLGMLEQSNRGVFLAVVLCVFLLPARMVYFTIHDGTHERQMEKIDYVLQHTTPEDRVYDGLVDFNVFRKDLDYFWITVEPDREYLRTYRQLAPYEYDVTALIDRYKPKIISSAGIPDMEDPRIADHYSLLSPAGKIWNRNSDETVSAP
jgi:hypothetical protein